MKVATAFVIPALATLSTFAFSGCASKNSNQDPGLAGDGTTAASAAPDKNANGEAYPNDLIGTKARHGSTPGDRIQNFKFLGYPDADESQGLQPLSLAQFYDPSGTKYRLIHIQAAGVWCSACQAETTVVVPLKAQISAKKAVWLVSLAEGPSPGTPSVQGDLDRWIAQYKSPFTHWLDPSNHNLGPFYDRTALPWNANIDARTMEILTSGTGAAVAPEAILQEIDDAIAMTNDSTVKIAGAK